MIYWTPEDSEYLDHLQKFISRVPTQNGAHLWIGLKKPTCPRHIFKYQKADYDGFRQELKELIPSFLEKANTLDLNILWIEFKSIIHRLMEKYIPIRTLRGKKKPKPWITKTIRALHRKNKKCHKHVTNAPKGIGLV